ncbi:MAG TPA: outer membrane beta-barrel protein [Cyclobacteriaceae bacterium]|nr:outer membrane beta-barrel protein [Cyclobacteriaceae bacterium]
MRTIILSTAVFLLVSIAVQAQQIHVGLTSAYNATFVLDKGLSQDPRYQGEYTYNLAPIGFSFGVEFGRTFGLSLESILSKQGQIYQILDAAEQIKGQREISLSYVHLPLLMRFLSGGTAAVRTNFNLGPQLSFLTEAVERMDYQAGTYTIPNDPAFVLPDGAVDNGDGTYTAPGMEPSEIMSKKANQFRDMEFQIAAAFGIDIDLAKHLFLSTQIRANYSLTDMRTGDVIDSIQGGEGKDLFSHRANMLVGLQVGLHYTFGVTRSFRYRR